MLEGMWQEVDYNIDICRVTKEEHVESVNYHTKFTAPVSKNISFVVLHNNHSKTYIPERAYFFCETPLLLSGIITHKLWQKNEQMKQNKSDRDSRLYSSVHTLLSAVQQCAHATVGCTAGFTRYCRLYSSVHTLLSAVQQCSHATVGCTAVSTRYSRLYSSVHTLLSAVQQCSHATVGYTAVLHTQKAAEKTCEPAHVGSTGV
jgi:hypothetical protein